MFTLNPMYVRLFCFASSERSLRRTNPSRSRNVPGTTAKLEILGEFAPLAQSADSEVLFGTYAGASRDLGLTVTGEFSGGCADSGFTAGVGCPTICAVGPVGGNAHTAEEYLEIASIVPRAQALALAILRLDPPK